LWHDWNGLHEHPATEPPNPRTRDSSGGLT